MASPHSSAVIPAPGKTLPGRDRCPWCGQAVTHEQFEAITAQIAARERERAAQVERALRERLAAEKTQIEAAAQAQIATAKRDAAAAVATATKAAAERETRARADAKQAAEAAGATRIASAEMAKKVALEQLAAAKANTEAVVAERLRAQREALDLASLAAVNAEKAKAFAERQKLEEKLAGFQRQLQQRTADELGEGAEVDLFEALRAEFPDDRFTRVKKGTPGADIVHEIVHNGRTCGRIVYDAKNRDAWRNDYATKLRADQLAAKADHAILASRVFPAGAHQIHLQDGVIVANPARVIDLVHLLRRHVVTVDGLRLAGQARQEKAARLYEFITSDRCGQFLDEIDTLADDLLGLDVKEVKAHEATWRQRGQLLRSVQRVRGSLVTEIEQIIGTGAMEQSA
jgi:hypothetical protein